MPVHFHSVFYLCVCVCTYPLHVWDTNAYALLFLGFSLNFVSYKNKTKQNFVSYIFHHVSKWTYYNYSVIEYFCLSNLSLLLICILCTNYLVILSLITFLRSIPRDGIIGSKGTARFIFILLILIAD